MPKVLKIIFGIIGGIIIAAALVVFGVNVFVQLTYAQFNEKASVAVPIPGLNNGFIPQDIDYLDDADAWLFSGYAQNDAASPIYKRNSDESVARIVPELPNGEAYAGHGSGITSNNDYVFLTQDEGILVFSAEDVATAEDGQHVRAIGEKPLDFTPAFMNIENGILYLGNFYREGNYETPDHHRIETPAGETNPAVMYAYPQDDQASFGFADAADRVYSITERIQGMCETPSGNIVLSQSYGLASSYLLEYGTTDIQPVGTFYADGQEVPLYSLNSGNLENEISAPPMSEGIEYHEGKIYVSFESATDKYIFGKLYGAGNVFALTL